MKVLHKQTYQTYAAIVAYEYLLEHEGEEYFVIHSVTDEGEEFFDAYNVDGYKGFEWSGKTQCLNIKESLIQYVKNMQEKVEY